MTDRSVEKEIEANNRRKEAQDDDDGSLVDTVENVLDPITDAIVRDDDDPEDETKRRIRNDSDQRA